MSEKKTKMFFNKINGLTTRDNKIIFTIFFFLDLVHLFYLLHTGF